MSDYELQVQREPQDDLPLVSFFIMAYNQEECIRAAIEGAFAQTYQPLEILLSDDTSSDRTFTIMEEMASTYRGPHQIILNRNAHNLGHSGHTDRIMELANGLFVVNSSGDDISLPERTTRLVEAWLASGRQAAVIHSAVERMTADGQTHEILPKQNPMHRHSPLALLRKPPSIYGASMGWARELFKVFGPLGPKPIFPDFPICLRAATLGEVIYLDTPLVHYRVGGVSWPDAEKLGFYALYGHRLKFLKWHLSFSRLYLDDMTIALPPDAEACRAQCEKNIRDFSFEIALAEMSYGARIRALPKALLESIRHRDAAQIRKNIKYIFDRPYMIWLNRRDKRSGELRCLL